MHSCVLVRLRGADSTGRRDERQAFGVHHEDGCSEFSTSAVLLSPRHVLASGALLSPFLSADNATFSPGVRVECVLQGPDGPRVHAPLDFVCFLEARSLDTAVRRLVAADASMWQIGWTIEHRQELARIRKTLLSTPTASSSSQSSDQQRRRAAALTRTSFAGGGRPPLGLMAVLAFSDPSFALPDGVAPARLRSSPAQVGEPVCVVSSPYGVLAPHMFFNSTAVGVVSNRLGDAALLVDARCLPGSEGGGVFDRDGHLLGVLTAPVSRTDLLPLDLQFCHTAESLLGLLPADLLAASAPSTAAPPVRLSRFLDSAVLVKLNGNRWATGVALNTRRCHVVTSAHLFWDCVNVADPYGDSQAASAPPDGCDLAEHFRRQGNDVQIRLGDYRWYNAELVFLSPSCLDVAVVALATHSPPDDWRPLSAADFQTSPPPVGGSVTVAGFGLFGPQSQLPPSLTCGHVAKIIGDDTAAPLLLQTTAVVHQGNSGGPIFDSHTGQLLAIVACNTRQRDDTIIPRLNFAILCAALGPLIAFIDNDGERIADLHPWLQPQPQLADYLWKWKGQPIPPVEENMPSLLQSLHSRL